MTQTPFSLRGLDHVVLRVVDMDRSRDFYEGVLGCVLERELPDLGLYQYRAGQHLIDLVPVGSKLGGAGLPGKPHHNQDHFCLTIDPFEEDSLLAYLASRGISTSEIGRRYGAAGFGPSVYIEDPDGNTIELKQFVSTP